MAAKGENTVIIAVMTDKPEIDGVVTDRFENASALVFWETDTETIVETYTQKEPEEFAKLIAKSEAEAVACGSHIGQACFEPIADMSITRYDGTGLTLAAAAKGALIGYLPIIPEYEGGPGCGSGTGSCSEHEHDF